jgi:hypothetical protein
MIEVGDTVRTLNGKFEGRVMGEHGRLGTGGASRFKSLPEDLNISVYTVINSDGEIRQFAASALEKVSV